MDFSMTTLNLRALLDTHVDMTLQSLRLLYVQGWGEGKDANVRVINANLELKPGC